MKRKKQSSPGSSDDSIIDLVRKIQPSELESQILSTPATTALVSTVLHLIDLWGSARTRSEGDDYLLFLSCCRDYCTTFNGCAAEIVSWLEDEENNFEHFISELYTWTSTGELNARRCRTLLDECHGYLHEYHRKRELFFSRYDSIVRELDNAFGRDLQARLFWEKLFKETGKVSNRPDLALQEFFALLDHLAELSLILTRLSIRYMHDGHYIPRREPPGKPVGEYISDYNSKRTEHGILSFCEIPVNGIGNNRELYPALSKGYSDIRRFFYSRIHASLYAGVQYDFIVYILPRNEAEKRERLELAGYKELRNAFVLYLDLKHSKLATYAALIKSQIANEVKTAREKGVPSQDVGGDAFVFCLDTLAAVKEKIADLQTLFGPLKDADASGAPKMSLNFGNVFYHHEYQTFNDVENTIANANYALEAYKELSSEFPDPSSLLFVVGETKERLDST